MHGEDSADVKSSAFYFKSVFFNFIFHVIPAVWNRIGPLRTFLCCPERKSGLKTGGVVGPENSTDGGGLSVSSLEFLFNFMQGCELQ